MHSVTHTFIPIHSLFASSPLSFLSPFFHSFSHTPLHFHPQRPHFYLKLISTISFKSFSHKFRFPSTFSSLFPLLLPLTPFSQRDHHFNRPFISITSRIFFPHKSPFPFTNISFLLSFQPFSSPFILSLPYTGVPFLFNHQYQSLPSYSSLAHFPFHPYFLPFQLFSSFRSLSPFHQRSLHFNPHLYQSYPSYSSPTNFRYSPTFPHLTSHSPLMPPLQSLPSLKGPDASILS